MKKKLTPAQVRLLAKLYSGKKVRWHQNASPDGFTPGDTYACRLRTEDGLLIGRGRDDGESLPCALALLRRGLIEEENRDEYGPICRISEAGRQAYVGQVSPS